MNASASHFVFTQTNDGNANEVVLYERDAGGALVATATEATGGRGNGMPHLPSQNSIVVSEDGRFLFVANAGSDDVSSFRIAQGGIALVGRTAAGGAPTSVAVHGDLVYVLTTGDNAGVVGFRLGEDGSLSALPGGALELSAADADPAQASFSPDGSTLVVSERGTDKLTAFAIDDDGAASERNVVASAGPTPYGFEFTSTGALVVTEAAGGKVGAASASSYRLDGPGRLAAVSGPVGSTRSEVCWAAISKDDRYAYVTNFGDGTISSYTIGGDGTLSLLEPIAASTVDGRKGIRDEAFSSDGQYLYALHADVQKVFGWSVGDDGSLDPIGAFGDLPETVAGLAVIRQRAVVAGASAPATALPSSRHGACRQPDDTCFRAVLEVRSP
jgi:6-phosphogluconolactonase (cycloisomerase 2 family)